MLRSAIPGRTQGACKDVAETIQHKKAGCEIPAGRAYVERYNQMVGIMYRNTARVCFELNAIATGSGTCLGNAFLFTNLLCEAE